MVAANKPGPSASCSLLNVKNLTANANDIILKTQWFWGTQFFNVSTFSGHVSRRKRWGNLQLPTEVHLSMCVNLCTLSCVPGERLLVLHVTRLLVVILTGTAAFEAFFTQKWRTVHISKSLPCRSDWCKWGCSLAPGHLGTYVQYRFWILVWLLYCFYDLCCGPLLWLNCAQFFIRQPCPKFYTSISFCILLYASPALC